MTGRMAILERIDATLAAGEKPTRDPAPFHLRKVYPPDKFSLGGFPWDLSGQMGVSIFNSRFTSADAAYRYVREMVERERGARS